MTSRPLDTVDPFPQSLRWLGARPASAGLCVIGGSKRGQRSSAGDTGAMITPADVAAYAAGGESETVEFKETTGQRQEAARTLSALLNGQGGLVLFGVRPNGAVAGQQVADKTLEDVTQACRGIHPSYPPSIERIPVPGVNGSEILTVSVPSGNAKPYAYKGSYYVRSGAATVDMPDEVQLSLVLERAHAFDRWELAASARGLDAVDPAEVTAFRDEAIANNRAPFDGTAGVSDVLRALRLLDDGGEPNSRRHGPVRRWRRDRGRVLDARLSPCGGRRHRPR